MGLSSKVKADTTPDPAPLKQADEAVRSSRQAEQKKLALAKGLESTWSRGYAGKADKLGG